MWLLPSLARPRNLRRFFEAFRATGGSTPGLLLIDVEDYEAHDADYRALDLPLGWRRCVTTGRTQGDKIREAWSDVQNCSWFGLIGDDNIPETHGWDRALIDRLDGWNIVSCDDGWQAPRRLGNCWVMGGPLVRSVGGIFPPGLHHLFVDDMWEAIGREAGCWTCLMNVLVRHAHVLKGEAVADETHRVIYGDGRDGYLQRREGDRVAFDLWKEKDREQTIAAICGKRAEEKLASVSRVIVPEMALQPMDDAKAHAARMDRALSRSVFIATPIARHPVRQYTMSLAKTLVRLAELGIRAYVQTVVGSSNLPRARNDLAAAFLASDYTDMLFIDDDMGFDENAALRLLASDKPLIGAVGCKKVDLPDTAEGKWCVRSLRAGAFYQDEFGAIEVEALGTGFLKIERSVFEAMKTAHPDWKRRGWPDLPEAARAHYHRFFAFDPADPEEMGEDIAFCLEHRRLGGRVFVDPVIRLVHVGEMEFTGDFTALLEPAAQPFREAAE